MLRKYFYTAIFHKEENGGFWVSFPDFSECLTRGDDMSKAYEMAIDALGLALEDRIKENKVPIPTSIENIKPEENAYTVIVELDMLEYKRKHSSRPVKKTLSIPEWLNEEAIRNEINFSAVLQEALKAELGIV